MPLFGPPNVEKLERKGDIEGLIKALGYERDHDVRSRAAEALGNIGDYSAIEPLVTSLTDADEVRLAAQEALGKIGIQAVDPLLIALATGSNYVQESAIAALAIIGDERAVEPIINALQNKDHKVRELAVSALSQIGDERAVEPLIYALVQDKHYEIRCSILDELKNEKLFDQNRARELLITSLKKDEDFSVRSWAVRILGEIGDELAVESLISAVIDREKFVRDEARDVLDTLGLKESDYDNRLPEKCLPSRLPDNLPRIDFISLADWQGGAGHGEKKFEQGQKYWNRELNMAARTAYSQAIELGLTSVYEAMARMNLGKILLNYENVEDAVNQFIKVMHLSPQRASTAYDCSTYLALIYEELNMKEDMLASIELAKIALAHVDYTISGNVANKIKATVKLVYE